MMGEFYKNTRLNVDSALFGYSVFSSEKLTKIVEETIELIKRARKNENLRDAEKSEEESYHETEKILYALNNWMLMFN